MTKTGLVTGLECINYLANHRSYYIQLTDISNFVIKLSLLYASSYW